MQQKSKQRIVGPYHHFWQQQEMLSRLDRVIASRKNSGEKREMKVSEARPIIEDMVSERLISDDAVSPWSLHVA